MFKLLTFGKLLMTQDTFQGTEENKLAEVILKSRAGKASLILTAHKVYETVDKGLSGRFDTYIPINSIDSVILGWRRHFKVVVICGIFAFLGLIGVIATNDTSGRIIFTIFLLVGLIMSIAFWFYTPTQFFIKSGHAKLGGIPVSKNKAHEFMETLSSIILHNSTFTK